MIDQTSMQRAQAKYKQTPRGKYVSHKINAKQRGVGFTLTFDEWWDIWCRSGHWDERGARISEYVMCRVGDTGAYEIGNVYIGRFYRNFIDGHRRIRQRGRRPSLRE